VINLANVGITLSLPEQFWLTAIPNLIGSALRIPYTFAIAKFGGRLWTTISASLLLIPALLLAIIIPSGWLHTASHGTQMWILILCAATAGVGGGNFSSSMANISFFYPEGNKGFALGLNAAGGNLGVAVTQLLVPLVIIIGVPAAAIKLPLHHVHLAYAGLVWIPFIVAAALCAWLYMDSLTQAKTDTEAYKLAIGNRQTWIMSILYIGTFGSFIGYSFALPLVIKNTFPEFLAHHAFIANYLAGLAFIGALAGVGNGSTYRMIPSIFTALGEKAAAEQGVDSRALFKRQAAAVIGIAGAVGAFGGFLIQVVFRQASLSTVVLMNHATKTIHDKHLLALKKAAIAHAHQSWSVPALWAFLAAYVVFAGMTWVFYMRRAPANAKVPSLAYASI
jgi:NNP family nitrate/nitrite transporter-like MFS transporter